MMREFADKVVLITGAGSGIGRATALAFAEHGAKVVAAGRGASAEDTAAIIRSAGGEGVAVRADVSRAAEVEALVETALRTYGRLDIAFNNAGVAGRMRPLWECSEVEFDELLRINLKGVWLCMKHEIPPMRAQGGGIIVNMSSLAGLAGVRGTGVYGASKHGVVGLTRVAALELARDNIRVNAVCPAVIRNTGISDPVERKLPELFQSLVARHPMGRAGEPAEVAAAVLSLCSSAASFVTGHALPLDGGALAGF